MAATTSMLHTLRFSLRADAGECSLEEMRQRVERSLGCTLRPGGERHDMFLFQGELLGMEVSLGEWRGRERRRTFQLQAGTPAPSDRESGEWVSIDIGPAMIDLLAAHDAGQWRAPSDEEIIAEAEYGAERERAAEDEAAELWRRDDK